MTHLYLEPLSGISGDMLNGLLIDLGASSDYLQQELKKLVPEYMIPKKIVFLEEMPLNNNGKIDKKKLKELV